MVDRRGSRFAFEVLFLVALAVGLTLAEVRPVVIVGVMALGWVIVAALEWAAWRGRAAFRQRLAAALLRPPGRVCRPPQPLEQVNVGLSGGAARRGADLDRLRALRAEVLGEWPAPPARGGARRRPRTELARVEPDEARAAARRGRSPSRCRCRRSASTRALRACWCLPATRSTRSASRRRGGGSRAAAKRSPGPSRCRHGRRAHAACRVTRRSHETERRVARARARRGGAPRGRRGARSDAADTQPHRHDAEAGGLIPRARRLEPARPCSGGRTACGGVLRSDTIGVAQPTLPLRCTHLRHLQRHDRPHPGRRPRPVPAGAPVRPDRRARPAPRPARRADDRRGPTPAAGR